MSMSVKRKILVNDQICQTTLAGFMGAFEVLRRVVLSFIGVDIQIACKIVKNVFWEDRLPKPRARVITSSAYLKHFTSVFVWTTNSEDIGSFLEMWWFEISIPQYPAAQSYPHSIMERLEQIVNIKLSEVFIFWMTDINHWLFMKHIESVYSIAGFEPGSA